MSYEIDNYYNRHDPAKGYEKHLVRAGYGVQSAEINEIQEAQMARLKGVADALFRDGDLVRDCQAVVDQDTGAVEMEGGALYLRGAVRGVAPASFVIPIDRTVTIGVRLVERVVTEVQDPSLRDPAVGTRNYDEAGAGRLQVVTSWGWDGDGGEGDFFAVYTVENGILLSKEPPPQLDSVTNAIAKYDRDSAGGNYVISGIDLAAEYNREDEVVTVLVGEGRARVNGYPIEIPRSIRLIYPSDKDVQQIIAEPKNFVPGGDGKMRVNLDNGPLLEVQSVRITAEKTATLTHGAFTGAKDPLPDNSVLAIVEVKQGGTTYVANTDYKLTSNQVDWSPGGNEPAPGSTYTVKYQYITTIVPIEDQDDYGFTIGGAVSGSLFTVDYTFALRRHDVLVLDPDGRVTRLKGVASQYSPAVPGVPESNLRIATLEHNWYGDPRVVRDPVVMMPMDELQGMRSLVFDLFDLVAQERLRNDIALTDPTAKRGLFVDPFNNDNLRDGGISQNLAVIDGELMLPIAASVNSVGVSIVTPQLLPYTLETLIEQPYRTSSMKVNPYMAFDPIPATLELSPGVDFWTENHVVWTSEETRRFVQGWGNRSTITTSTGVEVVGVTEQVAAFLRPISVTFKIRGFGVGEILSSLTFDGIPVTPENA